MAKRLNVKLRRFNLTKRSITEGVTHHLVPTGVLQTLGGALQIRVKIQSKNLQKNVGLFQRLELGLGLEIRKCLTTFPSIPS